MNALMALLSSMGGGGGGGGWPSAGGVPLPMPRPVQYEPGMELSPDPNMGPVTRIGGAGGPTGPGDNPLRRLMMGLAMGGASAQPGLSPGMAFARGLGSGVTGLNQLDTQREERERQRQQQEFTNRLQTLNLGLNQRAADRADQAQQDTRDYRRDSLQIQRDRNERAGRGGFSYGRRDPAQDLDRAMRLANDDLRRLRDSGQAASMTRDQEEAFLRERRDYYLREYDQRRAASGGVPVAPSSGASAPWEQDDE